MATRRRNTSFVLLTGVEECDKLLQSVGKKIGNRVARRVLNSGVRLAAKKIKAQTDIRSVKKAIGGSVKKKHRATEIVAKAGAGVAIKKSKAAPKGGTRGGVGIGAANVHWYILGTAERRTKAGKSTGRMPAHDIVKDANVGGAVKSLIKREFPRVMEEEMEKESKRLLKRRR